MEDRRHATSKSRIHRIDRFYHQSGSADRRRLSRATRYGLLGALALGGGLLLAARAFEEESAWAFSSGPLAGPHAAFESDCAACHSRGFEPIPDAACLACHEGPSHHANLVEEPRCVSCHVEHRGREASLTALDDQACVICHGDLQVEAKPKPRRSERVDPHIVSFTEDSGEDSPGHGEFAVLKAGKPAEDRNRIVFNHKLHMGKEQVRLPDWDHADSLRIKGAETLQGFAFTDSQAGVLDLSDKDFLKLLKKRAAKVEAARAALGRIDGAGEHRADAVLIEKQAWREPRTYVLEESGQLRVFEPGEVEVAEASPNRLRALSCTDCHEPMGDGAYLGPVSFERHCSSCHALEAPTPQASIVTSAGATDFALGPNDHQRVFSEGVPQEGGGVTLKLSLKTTLPHGRLEAMRSALQELYLDAAERYGARNPLKAPYQTVSTDPDYLEKLQRACEGWRRDQAAKLAEAQERVEKLEKLGSLGRSQRKKKRRLEKSLKKLNASLKRFDKLSKKLGLAAKSEAEPLLEEMAKLAKIRKPSPSKKEHRVLVSSARFAVAAAESALAELALADLSCGKCHDVNHGKKLKADQLRARRYEELADRQESQSADFVFEARLVTDRLLEVKVPPPEIPTRWLAQGRFDHRAHRSFRCESCHPNAEKSRLSGDMLLPSVNSCMSCHNEDAARSDCLSCHGYHPRSLVRPQGPEDLWQRYGAGEKR